MQNPEELFKSYSELEHEFKSYLELQGHPLDAPMEFDTPSVVYFPCSKKAKSKTDARYIAHSDGRPTLLFWCHCCGLDENYSVGKDKKISRSPAEQLRFEKEKEDAKAKKELLTKNAIIGVRNEWAKATPCINHPYLNYKRVTVSEGDGLRINSKGDLLTPVYIDGELYSRQRIYFDRNEKKFQKRFFEHAPTTNGYHIIGTIEAHNAVYFGEGIATCLTIKEATDGAVVCVYGKKFHDVAPIIAKSYPHFKHFVYCIDHPTIKEKITSKDSANKAIAKVGGICVLPDFSSLGLSDEIRRQEDLTDFNDLFVRLLNNELDRSGALSRVRQQLTNLKQDVGMIPERQDKTSAIKHLEAPEMRFKLLSGEDLSNASPMRWLVRGVIPEKGLAILYGSSGSGKSFLILDMGCAIAAGDSFWFGLRITKAQVTYVCLEGEAGLGKRVKAWAKHHKKPFPDAMRFITQPFNLLSDEDEDISELAKAVIAAQGAGGLIIIDTMNRAAPVTDENSSNGMGSIIAAATKLQRLTGGLVLLVHHSGKDLTKGPRGHSSLRCALDAAIEVTKTNTHREWNVDKSKDDVEGTVYSFKLEIVNLGSDDNGDSITSCVVKRDENIGNAMHRTIPRNAKNQKIIWEALRGLLKASNDYGKAGAPTKTPCIRLDEVIEKTRGYLSCIPIRHSERVKKAIKRFLSKGWLRDGDGWIWIT